MNNYKIFLRNAKCSYCDNKISIHRKFSGENLCPECFQKNIEKQFYKTISKYQMLRSDDKIVVALSGGKDSITLLYNLNKFQSRKHKPNPIFALIIDEGIKGYRENSVKKAMKFCDEYNIEYKIISFKEKIGYTLDEIVAIKKECSDYKYACNYCATIRRRLLNDGAKELGGTVLAMGHNLTDFAETYMMNILYKRLDLIANQYLFKQENDDIARYYIKKISPLFRIPEEEIFLYVNIKNLNYYSSHCPYREIDPIIRKRVLDFIQECKKYSPEIEFNLLNCFLEISETLYHYRKKMNYNFCQKCGYPCGSEALCSYCSCLKELGL
ncbi:MAG: ATP-binding protein [Candidatus Thorarchaeota archaeon]